MTEENKKALDDNRRFFISLTGPAQMLTGLNNNEKSAILKAAREEFFGAGYSPDLWCGPCIAEFIIRTYRAYDNWLASQPVIVLANFPKHDS